MHSIRRMRSVVAQLLYWAALSSVASAQALVNGGFVDASIALAGESDTYTFSVNQGEGVQVQIAALSSGALVPRLTLTDPDGISAGATSAAATLDILQLA
jgi:hypothetical protein